MCVGKVTSMTFDLDILHAMVPIDTIQVKLGQGRRSKLTVMGGKQGLRLKRCQIFRRIVW